MSLFTLFAQSQVRSMPAIKITQSIKIDGNLDDAAWTLVQPTSDFITSSPAFGKNATHRTEVKITYDNSAVYVGAYMYADPLTIRKQITSRDVINYQDVDYFVVGFDTYHDRQNAFIFRVTAAGTQGDAKQSNAGIVFDQAWDAVWESKTSIKKDGWVVEMKIPFSAIRFSKKNTQDWGINFARFSRKDNENSIWNPVNPNINGDVNQWGDWVGLKDITPPLRLSFLPYLSSGFRISPTKNGNVTEYLKSGGMDVKYGINESFTLDMTLIPDFAQVQSDNIYLNLTPLEVKFEDYRPFFTEGTELFNKAGLFYSRRIGAEPTYADSVLRTFGDTPNYKIKKNPGITRLYNATKFSGRTKGNLGIGVFNAISAPMYAKLQNFNTGTDSSILTEPLTNYNIIVFDQALKHRSSISFTNTNVLRKGNTRNANVSSINLSLFDKKTLYNFNISGRYSAVWGKYLKKNGFSGNTGIGKVSGLFQYGLNFGVESDNYDPNDLGYIQNNNSFTYDANISYNVLKPTKHFLNHTFRLQLYNEYLYRPFEWSTLQVNGRAFFLFKNFWDVSFNVQTQPIWYNDYFVHSNTYTGYFLKRAPYWYFDVVGSSDSRKKLYFNYQVGGAESPLPKDPFWTSDFGLRYRFNDHFQMSTSLSIEQDRGNWGWAFMNNPDKSPIIARRNVKRNTAILSAQYSFTPRMNWTVRLRHYWSLLNNTNFYDLRGDGYWQDRPFINGKDVNFNTFNLDMFYTWDFLLGSRVTVAWKNALGGNSFIDPYSNISYFKNLGKVLSNDHSNEITVKVVYFLDHLKLKKKK